MKSHSAIIHIWKPCVECELLSSVPPSLLCCSGPAQGTCKAAEPRLTQQVKKQNPKSYTLGIPGCGLRGSSLELNDITQQHPSKCRWVGMCLLNVGECSEAARLHRKSRLPPFFSTG